MKPLLHVKNLTLSYISNGNQSNILSSVSFKIFKGEIVGLMGESGSGKTTIALSLINLLPNNTINVSGSILFQDKEILGENSSTVRGKEIGLCLQDPLASLNPVLTIGYQIREVVNTHLSITKDQVKEYILKILYRLHFQDPELVLSQYPHELSGGMRQRILLLMTIISKPKLLILDEPTTSLDMLTEKSIIDFILELKIEFDLTILFISHNSSLVKKISDRTLKLEQGKVNENCND